MRRADITGVEIAYTRLASELQEKLKVFRLPGIMLKYRPFNPDMSVEGEPTLNYGIAFIPTAIDMIVFRDVFNTIENFSCVIISDNNREPFVLKYSYRLPLANGRSVRISGFIEFGVASYMLKIRRWWGELYQTFCLSPMS